MKIKPLTWLIFTVSALAGLVTWFSLSYHKYSYINLSINRTEALRIAKDYLKNDRNVDTSNYMTAVGYVMDKNTDRYLQKSLGPKGEIEFLNAHNYELFFWVVRFFRENEKEEYRVTISSATGEITGFKHIIKAMAARLPVEREEAKKEAVRFLEEKFNHDIKRDYIRKGEFTTERDNRKDHTFGFQKKNVFIPWHSDPESGGAKIITGAQISGKEVLMFSKQRMEIPEDFNRYLSRQTNVSRNISIVTRIFKYILFIGAVFYIIVRKNHLAMHMTKRFYIITAVSFIALTILADLNQFEYILMNYKTTLPFNSYISRHLINMVISIIMGTVGIIIPGLSGESLNFEQFPNKKRLGFLHYVRTSFLSREVFELICLGYLVSIILIGLQSIAINFGQRYLGVWVENTWVTQLTSTYFPVFTAFYIGMKASFFEEIIFRLFAISFIKKYVKRTFLAVLIASLIWGFAHTGYLVFPMWFRGVEVTLLGIFISIIFLRYGIIPVLVAHYLFDVFWSSLGYLFGRSEPLYFYSSVFVLCVPMIFGLTAFFINKKVEEKPLKWHLNKHQLFNLDILASFLRTNLAQFKSKEELKNEIVSHGWDTAVVDVALDDLDKNPKESA